MGELFVGGIKCDCNETKIQNHTACVDGFSFQRDIVLLCKQGQDVLFWALAGGNQYKQGSC